MATQGNRTSREDPSHAIGVALRVGTELALNGEPKGVIEGADISSALFAIWLGEQALDESPHEQLLAKRRGYLELGSVG